MVSVGNTTKESGNPVLPGQAGVWIASTRKRFLHLVPSPKFSLKRPARTGQGSLFPLRGRPQRSPSDFWCYCPVCSSPRFVFVSLHSSGGQLLYRTRGPLTGSPWGSKSAVFSHRPLQKDVGSLCKSRS